MRASLRLSPPLTHHAFACVTLQRSTSPLYPVFLVFLPIHRVTAASNFLQQIRSLPRKRPLPPHFHPLLSSAIPTARRVPLCWESPLPTQLSPHSSRFPLLLQTCTVPTSHHLLHMQEALPPVDSRVKLRRHCSSPRLMPIDFLPLSTYHPPCRLRDMCCPKPRSPKTAILLPMTGRRRKPSNGFTVAESQPSAIDG